MSWDLRTRFLKCFVWSTLTYGSETWTISEVMKKRLEAMEMWCYRKMLRISWTERITNEEVLRRAGTKRTLLNSIRARQLSCLGHDLRTGGLEKTCLLGMIAGKRARGRQRQTYLKSLTQHLGGGFKTHDLLRLAQDRSGWRSMVAYVKDTAPR